MMTILYVAVHNGYADGMLHVCACDVLKQYNMHEASLNANNFVSERKRESLCKIAMFENYVWP